MCATTLVSTEVIGFVFAGLLVALFVLPFIPEFENFASQPSVVGGAHQFREDEGRPRPQGVPPRGFQVQAAGASAQSGAEEAERQRVAARLKAEADERSRRHVGWENLVPGVPCLIDRICGAMAMPRLVQPQADVLPPARVQ